MSVGQGFKIGVGIALGGCGALVLLVAGAWWFLSAGNDRLARARAEHLERQVALHRVEPGMSEDQVRRALGDPKLIDGDRWLYPGHKPIQMKDGKVWLIEP